MTKTEPAAMSKAVTSNKIVTSLKKLRLLRYPSANHNQMEEDDFANLSFVEREVLEFNLDMQQWLAGTVERSPDNFTVISSQLATGFGAITSSGRHWRRDSMLTQLEQAWGVRGTEFVSTILELRVIVQTAVLAAVSYEIHEVNNGTKAPVVKFVTAILALNSRNRNNIEWLHYHEGGVVQTSPAAKGE
ncbi:MAG: hypothetical protein QM523_04760 [Candidatus Pacebacteria bacterium]|nr:hypothetical protein [Candidatus Paceibacterota bacterium]